MSRRPRDRARREATASWQSISRVASAGRPTLGPPINVMNRLGRNDSSNSLDPAEIRCDAAACTSGPDTLHPAPSRSSKEHGAVLSPFDRIEPVRRCGAGSRVGPDRQTRPCESRPLPTTRRGACRIRRDRRGEAPAGISRPLRRSATRPRGIDGVAARSREEGASCMTVKRNRPR